MSNIFQKFLFLLSVLIFAIFPQCLYSEGYKYFKNYSIYDYNNQAQNWAVLQDKRGNIYLANQGSLMEYDGVTWRQILVKNRVTRSIAIDPTSHNGIIYIGGYNEIGYAFPDESGNLQYVSLRDRLPKEITDFAEVRATHYLNNRIYFQTINTLFIYNPKNKQIKTFPIQCTGKSLFLCNGKLYIYQTEKGLSTFENDTFQPVPGVPVFPSRVAFICPFDSHRILIATATDGLFLYDGIHTTPFSTDVDSLLKKNEIYSGTNLQKTPQTFAIGTFTAGMFIIDSKGKLQYLADKTAGLPDNTITHIFEDSRGNLWLSLFNGLSKIEYTSPFFIYDGRNEITGICLSIARHNNIVFAGTTQGLFYFSPEGKFRLVPDIPKDYCMSLVSAGNFLLAGCTSGLYCLNVSQSNPISSQIQKISETPTDVLLSSKIDSNKIWAGTNDGLCLISRKNENSSFTFNRIALNNGNNIRNIVEEPNGNLWLVTTNNEVIKVNFLEGKSTPNIIHFTKADGLPTGDINISYAAGHIVFYSGTTGLVQFNEKEKRFVPDQTLGSTFALNGPQPIFRLVEDQKRNICFHSASRNYYARYQQDNTYEIISRPFGRIPYIQVNAIFPDPQEDSVWLATSNNSLIQFHPQALPNTPASFNALIRKVKPIKGKIPVFNGFQDDQHVPDIRKELQYQDQDSDIRFEFAAPFFEDEPGTTYSYYLEGYDENWAPFSSETQKDYTNLSAGVYTFRVKAQNVYGDLSKEAFYRFKVLPPWYQTWWAYVLYATLFFFLMYLYTQWRSWQLTKDKHKLEKVIETRTHEIHEKNIQLESQTEQLKDQSNKLKELDEAKSRFFDNISHEFRTPLTLLIGPLEQILSTTPDNELKTQSQMMLRNSYRLLNLVNQLLELARFDSGKMKLQTIEADVIPFVKNLVMCFDSLATREKLTLSFHAPNEPLILYFDPDKLEKILTNLLSNAFNYTPAGGKISIEISSNSSSQEKFLQGCVEIKVSDTGAGIPSNQLPHIFDRFYRVEGNYEAKRKGTGIGLALTREAVELHHGTISVTSSCEPDQSGTTFFLCLPMGKDHLNPQEIDEINHGTSVIPQAMIQKEITVEGTQPLMETPSPIETPSETTEKENKKRRNEEKPCVLIVEDNADVRQYIGSALGDSFHIEEAVDGTQGIIRARDLIPDLIISDVMMPGADGFQLCKTVKTDILTSHIPVILLTARTGKESELTGLECGADDYIIKPFSTTVLSARAMNLIQIRRTLQMEHKNRMSLQPVELPVSPLDDAFYQTLCGNIEARLSDSDLNVDALAGYLEMSQATLYRKVMGLTGITPVLFIRSYRLKRAAQLLETGTLTVAAVAERTGFNSLAYFSKCFKDQFHMMPSDVLGSRSSASISVAEVSSTVSAVTDNEKPLLPVRSRPVILVVEDNDDARRYIREGLTAQYHIVEAIEGGEAIARALEIIPDIVVSDVIMPGTDGFQLCHMLKNEIRTSHIPVILLTARASEENIIKGLQTGADDYISKPFNMELLKARIANLIHLREVLQLNRNREMALMPVKINEGNTDKEFLKDLEKVMEANYRDEDFSVEILAEKLYISGASLYRKIKALTGESPVDYIRSYRLNQAAKLFKENFGTVTEVAFEVGFKNRTHFTRSFKERFHQLPSSFATVE